MEPTGAGVAAHLVALIADRLPDTAIEHVGSSSVSGCAGKGYLDLVIPYRDDSHFGAINDARFALGFGRQRNRDPFPETRPMRVGAIDHEDETYLLHVHVVPERTRETDELLEFRNRLCADPALVMEYVGAKRAVLDAGVRDGDDYANKKGKLITALGYQGAEDE